jgi:hypothetical protein
MQGIEFKSRSSHLFILKVEFQTIRLLDKKKGGIISCEKIAFICNNVIISGSVYTQLIPLPIIQEHVVAANAVEINPFTVAFFPYSFLTSPPLLFPHYLAGTSYLPLQWNPLSCSF